MPCWYNSQTGSIFTQILSSPRGIGFQHIGCTATINMKDSVNGSAYRDGAGDQAAMHLFPPRTSEVFYDCLFPGVHWSLCSGDSSFHPSPVCKISFSASTKSRRANIWELTYKSCEPHHV